MREVRAAWVAAIGANLVFAVPDGLGAEPDPLVFCEVSHLNFAWGYAHAGVVIGPTGAIGQFRYGADDSRWVPNRNDSLTIEELRDKYAPGRRLIGQVCPQQMIWLRQQLDQAKYAAISKPVLAMTSDGGTQFTQCWMFADERNAAPRILLRETGEYDRHSTASNADALANWLEAVAKSAGDQAHLPENRKGCIAYPESLAASGVETLEQTPEMRDEAMKMLQSAGGLRCQLQDGHRTTIDGTDLEQHAVPEVIVDLNYDGIDFSKQAGRRVGFFDGMVEVRARVTPAGIALEDHEGEDSVLTTHVTPYRIDGRNRFPAIMLEVMASPGGAVAIKYAGACTVIPRS